MIKVLVKDLQNTEIASSIFETLEMAEAWVNLQTLNQSKCLWGQLFKVEHVCAEGVIDDHSECAEIEHPQTFTVEYIDLGNSVVLAKLREKRTKLLAECDWTQLPDSPLSQEKKQEFITYRQQLRDLPETAGSMAEVIWPVKPSV